nr:hypothetical protein [Acetobacter thailandicus]
MKMTTLEIIHDNRSTPKKVTSGKEIKFATEPKTHICFYESARKSCRNFDPQTGACSFSAVHNLFVPPAKKSSALSKHIHRLQVFAQWNSVAP